MFLPHNIACRCSVCEARRNPTPTVKYKYYLTKSRRMDAIDTSYTGAGWIVNYRATIRKDYDKLHEIPEGDRKPQTGWMTLEKWNRISADWREGRRT